MKKVIFSKYSNDRNFNYKIRTDILEDEDGRRYVRKTGVTEGGKKHVENMYEAARGLEKMYEGSVFRVNRSSLDNGALELEYIRGTSLEVLLDECLAAKDYDAFKRLTASYGQKIRALATEDFSPSEAYYKVFGQDAPAEEGIKSMPCSNIDMIFENLIAIGETYTVIDYEWTFMFPVPVDFVLYRTINYYATADREKLLADIDLYDILGVDKSWCERFGSMEKNFQMFVCRDNTPLWRLYEIMGRKYYFPVGLIEQKICKEDMRTVGILKYNTEGGFDADSIWMEADENGRMIFDIALDKNYSTVSIVPAKRGCMVYVNSITGITDEGERELQYGCDAVSTDNRLLCFEKEHQHIIIGDLGEEISSIRVDINISYCNNTILRQVAGMADGYNGQRYEALQKDLKIIEQQKMIDEGNQKISECGRLLNENNDKLNEYTETINECKEQIYEKEIIILEKNNIIDEKENIINQLNATIDEIRNSTSWKVTEPLRWVSGKTRR